MSRLALFLGLMLLAAPGAQAIDLELPLDRLLRAWREAEPAQPAQLAAPSVVQVTDRADDYTPETIPIDLIGLPLPSFTCEPHGLTVSLQDSSRHFTGFVQVWEWDFGDGGSYVANTRSANPVLYTYTMPGTYVISLTVMDQNGKTAMTSKVCLSMMGEERPAPEPAPAPEPETCPYALDDEGVCPTAAAAPVMVEAVPTATPEPKGLLARLNERTSLDIPIRETRVEAPADPIATIQAPSLEISPGIALVVAAPVGLGLATSVTPRLLWALRRLFGLAPMALFTRLKEDELLTHPVRSQIVQVVESQPGIHYQQLVRTMEKGNGVLEHHLRMLTQAGLVRERATTGYTCYFPAAMDRRLMDLHTVMKSDVARQVFEQITTRPGSGASDVAKSIGVTPKAVSYHLNRFEKAGIISLERHGRTLKVWPSQMPAVAEAAA